MPISLSSSSDNFLIPYFVANSSPISHLSLPAAFSLFFTRTTFPNLTFAFPRILLVYVKVHIVVRVAVLFNRVVSPPFDCLGSIVSSLLASL